MEPYNIDSSYTRPNVPAWAALQATNKEQSIRIQSSGGLNEDQIQQMVRDAESHAEADKARKQRIEAKNEAETAIISAERSVKVGWALAQHQRLLCPGPCSAWHSRSRALGEAAPWELRCCTGPCMGAAFRGPRMMPVPLKLVAFEIPL